ncbi:hypothetical protein BASA81_009104 [Batrachochytrium salamandrivorans]|nr:hypothetical protein BASA81_009104 [Batrachochytrium salamandrivorans]
MMEALTSSKVLRARPQPPTLAQEQPKPPRRESKPYSAFKEVLKFAASELDPRLIAHWPEQFQNSLVRTGKALASFRGIKFNDIVAAAVEICLLFTFATTFAATIFNEAGLTQYVALGTGCTLMAIIWVQGSFALFSDNGISIGGPEITPTVMLATMAGQMKQYMIQKNAANHNNNEGATLAPTSSAQGFDQQVMLATMLALIIITTMCFGLVIYTLGRLKLSKIIRLIPSAVLAGYMASIGYLVTVTAMKTSMPTPVYNYGAAAPMFWAYFLPGVAVGLAMYFQRRWKVGNPTLVLPLVLFTPIILFYIIVYGSGSDIVQAAKDGWMFSPFRSEVFYNQFVYSYGRSQLVDWDAIGYVASQIVVMMFVVTLESVMKQAATKKLLKAFDMRIDHELMLVGKANMMCALFVGSVGYPQPKLTYVNYSIVRNTTTRVGGMLVACVALILFFASFPLVNYLPRFWLTAVLIFAASGFIIDNLYDGLWIYTKKEYICMCAIVIINATVGMAWAVIGGMILSALIFAFSYSLQGSIKSIIPGSKFQSNVLRKEREEMKLEHLGQRAVVIQLHRFVFFGNASFLNEVIMGLIKEQEKSGDQQRAKYFVFDWAHVDSVDITASAVIFELVSRVTGCDGRKVIFTGLGSKLQYKLQSSIKEIHDPSVREQLPTNGPEQRVFTTLDDGVEFVEEQLLGWSKRIRERWFKFQSLEDFYVLSQLKNSIEQWQDLEFFSMVPVPQGWTLCNSTEVDENLYVLKEGTLVVYHGTSRAHVLKPGSFLNEAALCHHAMPQMIVAEEPSIVLALSPEDMARLERDFPAVSFELHRKVLDHSVRTREKIAMRLGAFKLWSRERVSRLAQANAAPQPKRSLEDLEAGPEATTSDAAVEPTASVGSFNFEPDLKRSLLDSNDESALNAVRDGAGEEFGRDLAQQLFAEDEDTGGKGGGVAQSAFISRMKRHSSAVSQLYPEQQQGRSISNNNNNNDVASAIYHQLASIHPNEGDDDDENGPAATYHLCPILQRNLQAAFVAHALRQSSSTTIESLELASEHFKPVLAVVGVCYREDGGGLPLAFPEFLQLAVELTTPRLGVELERKLAVFCQGKDAVSESALRRALPLTSSLAISRFVNLWDANGARAVSFSSLCSAVAVHLGEVALRSRLETEWNALASSIRATVDDVASAIECTTLQAQEMVWEADCARQGGLSLYDVLETLAL